MGQRWSWQAGGLFLLFPFLLCPFVNAALLTHGVASGDVTATSAVIWVRTDGQATLAVEYAATPAFAEARPGGTIQTTPETDFTGTVTLTALRPATRYYYRIRSQDIPGAVSEVGSFSTAPEPGQQQSITFLWSGDLGGQGVCRRPEYTIFAPMRALAADFFIFVGDTIYADSPCPSPPNVPGSDFIAVTQEQFWAKYRYQREDRLFRELLAVTPVYVVWDDHEVKNDFSGPTEPLTPLGLKAFFDYFPIQRTAAEPQRLYRAFRWGKLLELFLLDTRQYRSPNLQADEPKKTMLGPAQLRWLLDGLASSTARWKVIVSSVPLSTYTGNLIRGHDSWAGGPLLNGFNRELGEIVTALHHRNLHNVAWLSTDIHIARLLSYDPTQDGTPDFYEFISGPLSAVTGDLKPLDPTFHPKVLYQETNFFNFGVVRIDGKSQTLSVEIRDQEGKVHYSLTVPAR